jgi:uncharacterized protein (DUF2345 family)
MLNRLTLALAIVSTFSFSLFASSTAKSSLPLSAQSTISATLGADSQAYQAHSSKIEITAVNSAQDLSTRFTSRGIEVKSGNARWSLAFLGYGHGQTLQAAQPAAPVANSNRVEYRRGTLTEWYVNGPAGLEQGFTITQRSTNSQNEPLTIALSISGDLAAVADQDGQGLSLNDRSGSALLRYAGLTAYDQTGRELQSSMQVAGGKLLLHVDDAKAQYPITVDPTVQLAKLSATDGTTGAWLGYSIAISGSTIVVGAPQATVGSNTYQGAAYVFVEPKAGWMNMPQTAKLTASDGAPYNYFGNSVSIDGSTIVVGAMDADVNGNQGQGAAYVFVEPTAGWANGNETAKLTASDGGLDDFFGYSVSISGSTVVAGEPHATVNSNFDQGAAYVYVEPTSGWVGSTETAKLTSGGSTGDQFGQSVSINGSTIAVGAPYVEVGGKFTQGAAYVFTEPSGGWVDMTPTAELTVASGPGGDYFGTSIATSGSTVVAGAPGANSFAGAAYVFTEPSGGWANMTQTGTLTSSTGVADDLLGSSVSISGTTIVVGADHAIIGSSTWAGASYLFVMPTGGWTNMTQNSRLVVSHGSANTDFGVSVSIFGNTVAIGGYGYTSYTGAGFVFGNSSRLVKKTVVAP